MLVPLPPFQSPIALSIPPRLNSQATKGDEPKREERGGLVLGQRGTRADGEGGRFAVPTQRNPVKKRGWLALPGISLCRPRHAQVG